MSKVSYQSLRTILFSSLYYKTTILCTCSFAPFKFLVPLPGIDFFLFLPISIQSNFGFNLKLYFISSIYIYIFFTFLQVCFWRWMRHARTRNIIPFDLEIERTFRSQRKKKVLAMADEEQNTQPHTLKDYVRPIVTTTQV